MRIRFPPLAHVINDGVFLRAGWTEGENSPKIVLTSLRAAPLCHSRDIRHDLEEEYSVDVPVVHAAYIFHDPSERLESCRVILRFNLPTLHHF